MKKKNYYLDYLQDMLDAAVYARQFIAGMTLNQFMDDHRTQFAAIRALEIVGEASKKIPDQVKTAHPEIPWREIAGMRDKVVHDYISVNLNVVWKTLEHDIPTIIPILRIMIEEIKR